MSLDIICSQFNGLINMEKWIGLFCASVVHILCSIGFMHSCTTSWNSTSSLFPVCHYWSNWL